MVICCGTAGCRQKLLLTDKYPATNKQLLTEDRDSRRKAIITTFKIHYKLTRIPREQLSLCGFITRKGDIVDDKPGFQWPALYGHTYLLSLLMDRYLPSMGMGNEKKWNQGMFVFAHWAI